MSATGTVKAGRAYVEILADQTKLEQGLKKAQKKLKDFGSSLTNLGKSMLGIAALAGAPFVLATKTFASFDDEMRMVKAVSGATADEFASLTATAEKLGRETSFTAKQVAEGMTAMGRMGFNAKEIENAIPAVLNLSRATGTELQSAAETAANNMRVFGIDTSRMAEVADILTATANGSAQTLTDLAEGLKMAGPQASAAGDNITNVSAALGVLANMGIKGSLAGTALRKAYSQFANTKIQSKLKAIGITTTDTNGNLRAMPEIMADIAKQMNTMPTAERLGFAEEIFDLRGSLAGLQLGGNIKQLEQFIRKLQSVQGTADKTAREMDSGIGGAFRILTSAIEGCQIATGRIVGEALGPYIRKMSLTLNKMAEWIAAHKKAVVTVLKVIGIVAAAGTGLLALGLVFKTTAFAVGTLCTAFTVLKAVALAPITAVKGLITLFVFLKKAMIAVKIASIATWTAITSPAFLIGAALTGIVAIVWKLSGAWDTCAKHFSGIAGDFSNAFSEIGRIFGETWDTIKTALSSGDLSGAAKVAMKALKSVWLTGIAPLKKAWYELENFLSDSWTVIVYSLIKTGNDLWYGLLAGLKQIGNAIQDSWDFIWNGVVAAFEKTLLELQKAWIRTKGFFDSEEEVNAEINVVEREYNDRKQARKKASSDSKSQRESELKTIQDDWKRDNESIDTLMNSETDTHRQEYNQALEETAAEIENAKKEWQDAMTEVRINAERKSRETAETNAKLANASNGTMFANEQIQKASGEAKAVGAWSASELDALLGGDGSIQERTANAAEETVRQQKETNKQLKQMAKNTTGNIGIYTYN